MVDKSQYCTKEAIEERYYNKKKEKKKGIIQKFFELWQFAEDEEYYY